MIDVPIVHDEGAASLSTLISPARVLHADRRAASEVAAITHTLRFAALPGHSRRLTPRDATPFLIELRAKLEERARRDAGAYSSFRWLWYLRRLPDFLTEGRVRTTSPYTLAVAETMTEASSAHDAPTLRNSWISFKVDEHVARHVLMLGMPDALHFQRPRLHPQGRERVRLGIRHEGPSEDGLRGIGHTLNDPLRRSQRPERSTVGQSRNTATDGSCLDQQRARIAGMLPYILRRLL
jgi:hypothetical protein